MSNTFPCIFCQRLVERDWEHSNVKTVCDECGNLTDKELFQTWASAELARMTDYAREQDGLTSTYAVDKMDALRQAIKDGDELAYDLAIAQIENDGQRCEWIAAQIAERGGAV